MANSKEATIVIFDVSCLGSTSPTDDCKKQPDQDFFKNAKKCINRILQRKIFSMPHDEVGMLLMGSNTTGNQLNSQHSGYDNICEAFDLQCTNWNMLRVLESEIEAGQQPADWLDAIVVALDMLNRHTAKKLKTFKIVLVTTFQSPVNDESYDTIVQQLRTLNIDLVVITDHLHYDPDCNDGVPEFRKHKTQSAAETHSKELIMQLITETNGVICDFEQALVQLIYFEKKKQRTMPWNVPLELGSNLKIEVSAYIQIKESTVLTWKNEHALKTKYYVNDKELDAEAAMELVKGYRYGGEATCCDATVSTVEMPPAKCLSCIGFTSQASLRDLHFAGTGSWSVVAQKGRTVSEKMLVALVASLKETRRAAIVRYVYRAGCKAKVMALLPVESENEYRNGASLTMLELIFKDNITALLIPSLAGSKTEPSDEQLDAVDQLIDAMDLMDAGDTDETEPATEAFAFTKLLNPTLQYTYRVISHRALHPTESIPAIDSDLTDKINVPAKLKAAAADPLQTIRELFPLEAITKPSNELLYAKLNELAAAQSTSSSVTDAALAPTTTTVADGGLKLIAVGTVTPDEDFAELLRRGERFSTLCEQMAAVIVALVLKPLHMQRDKVGRAMMVFREEAKRLGAHRYNDFVEEFKRVLQQRQKTDVWQDVVVAERFGLITSAESEASAVTEQQAADFYLLGGARAVTAPEPDDENDDDVSALIDMM